MARMLALIPHPDDESYSFAGTLALAAMAGWECIVVCASSGEKGKRHDGGDPSRRAVATQRERELARSCEQIGAQYPQFLRLPDGALRGSRRGPELIAAQLARFDAEVLLTLGPDGAYGHPDHVALHRWVARAWAERADSAQTLLSAAFPRGLFLPQWEKCRHMLGDPPEPPAEAVGEDQWDYEVDIRPVREVKLAAIAAHRSQLPTGSPEALFPPGIVRSLLDVERFRDASRMRSERVAELFAALR